MIRTSLTHLGPNPAVTSRAARVRSDTVTCTLAPGPAQDAADTSPPDTTPVPCPPAGAAAYRYRRCRPPGGCPGPGPRQPGSVGLAEPQRDSFTGGN
jgi:hypothetical protein